jgi:hypothetical protein
MKAGAGGGLIQPRVLWIVVAALFVINLALFIVRDVHQLDNLRDMTVSQGSVVELARRLRERVDGEAEARTQLLAARARTAPLKLLVDVTRALPNNAWVQKLDWDGRVLHLAGYAPAGSDVPAALARFLSPHIKSNIAPGAGSTGANQPFDVSLELPGGVP